MSFHTINSDFIRDNEFLWSLNRKVPAMTPIEMKQEQVRFNPEGRSYEDGTKAGLLIQLAKQASWTTWSIQLARSASWTVRSVWMIGPYSCFVVRDRLSKAWSNLSWRIIVWILFEVVTKLDLGSSTSLFFWIFISFFFKRGHFFGSFWHWFCRYRFWPQQ